MPKTFQFGRKRRHSKARGVAAVMKSQRQEVQPEEIIIENDVPEVAVMDTAEIEISEHDDGNTTRPSRPEEKLAAFNTLDTSELMYNSSGHYQLIHTSVFSSLLASLPCPSCYSFGLHMTESSKMGLATKLTVTCQGCGADVWSDYTSPRGPKRHDVNYRLVLASKENAIGYTKLNSLFSIMNVPHVMHKKTYQEISVEVHDAAVSAAEHVMNQAVQVVKERYSSGAIASDQESSTGCPVTTISFDGTWQKRGHSSHNGVGVAIDVDTGLVVDTHTVCNFCISCEKGPKEGMDGFEEWLAGHRAHCQKNSECSSNAMEVVAAEEIFGRSMASRGLIYGKMLCDGDSKAFTKVNETAGYDIEIQKLDCINHIAKRMFNSLENVKKVNKSDLNRKLTRPMIDKITNTYATNLKDNAPDTEKMKLAVMGGVLHMASTDEKPNHRLCPQGDKSWCRYQRAVATGNDPPPHRPTFKPDIVPFIWPTIIRLTDTDLLHRCASMLTQNANESFNAQIWRRCPKTEFANRTSVETAVALATLAFNCGPCGLRFVMARLRLKWEKASHDFATRMIVGKVSRARKQTVGLSKWKRKHKKTQRLTKEHEREAEEGQTYQSGAFNL